MILIAKQTRGGGTENYELLLRLISFCIFNLSYKKTPVLSSRSRFDVYCVSPAQSKFLPHPEG